MTASFFNLFALDSAGQRWEFSQLSGRVSLIVNVASKCGFTTQYTALQELYAKYHNAGLQIVAFPCNQFGAQEPGTDAEIQGFCQTNFAVTFPIMQKVDVNGPSAHPVFAYLKSHCPGILGSEAIKWNFTKFLVDRTGSKVKRYAPQVTPQQIEADITAFLQESPS